MVNLSMAQDDLLTEDLVEDATKKTTKKSLRLSKRKQLVLKKKREEIEQREREEKQKTANDKKEKEEEAITLEIDDEDTDPKGKQKRHWESWAKSDKDLFFEAIGEFGKDFDKICSFMDKKAKSRAKSIKDHEPRNKDQIRYFYYRTWKQISKGVSIQPSESKRIQHEVYCLICYGELRKKIHGIGNKDLKKLDELVINGSTTVRSKGRKIRVKPPNCRFLKNLSYDEEKSVRELDCIPEHIDIELYPRSNKAWTAAQSRAFNPRIKLASVPITLKLKSLMKLLQRRFLQKSDERCSDLHDIRLFPPKEFVITADNPEKTSLSCDHETETPAQLQSVGTRIHKEEAGAQSAAEERLVTTLRDDNGTALPVPPSLFVEGNERSSVETCSILRSHSAEPNSALQGDAKLSNESNDSSIQKDSDVLIGRRAPCSNVSNINPAVIQTSSGVDSVGVIASSPCITCCLSQTVAEPLISSVSSPPQVTVSSTFTSLMSSATVSNTVCSTEGTPQSVQYEKTSDGSMSYFPITTENCTDKDLQSCFLKLNRPEKIRLEYDFDTETNKNRGSVDNSFRKLIMLAQRDLCKALKITTQQSKAASVPSKIVPSSKTSEPNQISQTFKPVLFPASCIDPILLTRQGIPFPVVPSPILDSGNVFKPPTGVSALKNVISPPTTHIIQRKKVQRLRHIQPASKTLMSKAIAVNIVPQPAQLVQFGQVPPASAQLINSGSAQLINTGQVQVVDSGSSPIINSGALPLINAGSVPLMTSAPTQLLNTGSVSFLAESTPSTEAQAFPITSTTFSAPSATALSSKLTIWGRASSEQVSSNQVQVEVLQEGGRTKPPAKRLHPTTITTTEKSPKQQCLEQQTASCDKTKDFAEFDLSFLGPNENSRPKTDSQSVADAINLNSILSGLTKNLCKNDKESSTTVSGVAANKARDKNTATSEARSITPPQLSTQPVVEVQASRSAIKGSESILSVLTTPKKNVTRTPSKVDPTAEGFRDQVIPFEAQWFGGDMAEISLGSLLDVASMKDNAKNSDSSQASEVSVGSLLSAIDKKDEQKKDEDCQSGVISIGKLLDAVHKDGKSKNPSTLTEPVKNFSTDSLIMKPDADPVTVFDSMMEESSIDCINKFKDLAARLKGESALKKTQAYMQGPSSLSSDESLLPEIQSKTTSNPKDPKLPIYTSEDSVGPLDNLSFVLPTNDSNSNDFTKGFS